MPANLALSVHISEIHENSSTLLQLIYSRNTRVKLWLKYKVYRNEYRSSKSLTTLYLSFITKSKPIV